MIPKWLWNILFLASWVGLFSFRGNDQSENVFVITDKHTKLRGLLVLKQKKREKRNRRRASVEWWMMRGAPKVDIKGGGGFSKVRKRYKIKDMIYKR